MAISSVSITPSVNSSVKPIVSNAAASSVNNTQSSANNPASATVTLSTQGQRLGQHQPQSSQTQAGQSQTLNTVDTVTAPNVVPQSKETTAAPGIQFMTGESKGGRVNTFV